MANEEHLTRLLQGEAAWDWNKWRENNPHIVPDLRGATLTGRDLTLALLDRVDLAGADLTRADLCGTDLTAIDFTEAAVSHMWRKVSFTSLHMIPKPSINLRKVGQVQAARRMLPMWFGKLFSTLGVILLILAVSLMGDFWDPRKSPLANTWRWIRNPRPDLATAVTVDPRLLYGGAFCAIIGILWS